MNVPAAKLKRFSGSFVKDGWGPGAVLCWEEGGQGIPDGTLFLVLRVKHEILDVKRLDEASRWLRLKCAALRFWHRLVDHWLSMIASV